jgi:hypothetical protein
LFVLNSNPSNPSFQTVLSASNEYASPVKEALDRTDLIRNEDTIEALHALSRLTVPYDGEPRDPAQDVESMYDWDGDSEPDFPRSLEPAPGLEVQGLRVIAFDTLGVVLVSDFLFTSSRVGDMYIESRGCDSEGAWSLFRFH